MQGHGYDITRIDVRDAYRATLDAATHHGSMPEMNARIRALVATEANGGFVRHVLGRELAL